MKINRLVPILCLAGLTLHPAPRAQSSAREVVIQNATVIDGTGAAPQRGVSILIADGRLREIGAGLRVPKDAQVVDGTGKFVIPGLMDMHVHAVWPHWVDQFMPLFVANGVTTVRDMFGSLELAPRLRKEIESGSRLGPRFTSPGPIVDGPKPVWSGSIAVTTAEDGRAAVRTVKEQGGDFVKVYSLLPRDAYFAIADEAKKQKIPFAGHVPRTVTAGEASDSGQRTIEHLSGLFLATSREEETLRSELAASTGVSARTIEPRAVASYDPAKADALFAKFVRNGTWHVPTLTVLRATAFRTDPEFTADRRLQYMPPATRTQWKGPAPTAPPDPANVQRTRALFDRYVTLVGAIHKAGVRILAGSDTPNPYVFPGFSLHDELGLLVRGGLTPLEALQAATRNAADFLGTLKETGTVERGKRADLVLLDANPLEDIAHTQRIHAVVVGGRLVTRQQIDTILSEIEKANRDSSPGGGR